MTPPLPEAGARPPAPGPLPVRRHLVALPRGRPHATAPQPSTASQSPAASPLSTVSPLLAASSLSTVPQPLAASLLLSVPAYPVAPELARRHLILLPRVRPPTLNRPTVPIPHHPRPTVPITSGLEYGPASRRDLRPTVAVVAALLTLLALCGGALMTLATAL
ncbi:hypothetical protein FB565_003319 [Actinoplanes lutulentus]|uniref:hypothetical protein n=1 Tax=Actinoplanes lutulentus TaxID=1287878 RepID=UPI0011B949A5|nr:hypothetical protein [Actinoplanes lutulentus]MBB2943590.1 hypothetical protein [Actinoplanes lutulentus]